METSIPITRRKASKKPSAFKWGGIATDILIMIALHLSLFSLYAITSTHYKASPRSTRGTHQNKQQNEHPKEHQPQQSKLDMHFFTKYHDEQLRAQQLQNSQYHGLLNDVNQQHYEPNYPKSSRHEQFPTHASQAEMAKHDRYIIHGLFYTNLLTPDYLTQHWSQPYRNEQVPFHPQNLCLTIFMKHRAVPYINALLMSLMGSHVRGEELNPEYKRGRGSGGHELLSYAQVHVIDAELVDLPHDEARQKIQNLPFVHTHSIHHGWYDSLFPLANHHVTSYKLEMIQQYLMAARVCQQSGLDWCLMMEEYTIVPLNFVLKLKRFITAPWQTYSHVQGNNGDSSHEVLAKTFSSISLFSFVNKDSNAPMIPHNVEYSQETYNRDRAKLNSERYTMNHEHKHHDDYELKPVPKGEDGTNVAMLFTNHVTTTQLIPMLEELYKAERNELLVKAIFKWTGDYTAEESKSSEETHVYFDLERELALYMGVPRFRTEPSLVNRIGFYDEYYPGSWNNKDSTTTNSYEDTIGITNWLTDPRFLFDAGSYWDDSVEYCLDANSNWIFDPYFDNETQSCCNPESDCAIKRKNKNSGSED